MDVSLAPSRNLVEPDRRTARRAGTLRGHISWTVAGNVVFAASQWGILIGVARVGSAEMLGQFALALATTTPVMMLTNMALRAVQATDARPDFSFGTYLALRLMTSALAMICIVVICATGGFRQSLATVVLLTGILKAIDSVSDILHGYLQQCEDFDLIAKLRGLAGLLSAGTVILVLAFTKNLLVSLLAAVAISLVRLLLLEIQVARRRHVDSFRFRPEWNPRPIKALAIRCAPLGVVTMLMALNQGMPRYAIAAYLGEAQVGIFAAIACLTAIGTQVVDAIGKSASPRLARLTLERRLPEFLKLLFRACVFCACLGLAGVAASYFFGETVLTAIYTAEFSGQSALLAWIMLAVSLSYVADMVGVGLTARGAYRVQPIIGVATLAAQAGACFLLVPAWGLKGAAWSLLIASATYLSLASLCLAYVVRRA